MSTSMFLICEKCKEGMWIGQGCFVLYYDDKNIMENLRKWWEKHIFIDSQGSHKFSLINETYFWDVKMDEEGYREIENIKRVDDTKNILDVNDHYIIHYDGEDC